MIVELNDKAFNNAKQGDIFVIEEKNGKKYARPMKKETLLADVYKRLEKNEKEVLSFKNIVENQNTNIVNYQKSVTDKLVKIAKIVGGYEDEKTI